MWPFSYILPSSFTPLFWLPRLSSVTFFASDIIRSCLCFLETRCGYQTPFPLSQGGGKGYWPNFDNRGDFMSFDTHIRTRPKSLLHLYSSIWDAHQVLNPPFFPHVKNKSKQFSPGTMPLLPHRHHAPHTKFQTHTPSISSSSLVQSRTTTPACHCKKAILGPFFNLYFFRAGEIPIPPETFSVGLGLPPSSRTHSIIRLVKVPSIVQERMVEDTPHWLGREVGNELRYRLTPLDASALL